MEAELTNVVKYIMSSELSALLVVTFIVLLFKDTIQELVAGVAFFMGSTFNEGDEVVFNNVRATIIKIGVRRTVFQQELDNGDLVWHYIYNSRIRLMDLAKVRKKQG